MNESLDLRNRILKMRESSRFVLDQVKSESKKTDTYSESTHQKLQNDFNTSELIHENKLEKENFPVESNKEMDSKLFKKVPPNLNIKNEEVSNKKTFNRLVNNNEAQFRMIAKKFNEAVEVILELSDKVKNLEETINSLSVQNSKNKKSYSFVNLKTYVVISITTLIILVLFTFPINLTLIKLIITDVISSI